MIDHRSYTHNLSSCEIKAWKKFRPERDSNLVQAWIFFRLQFHNCLSCVCVTAMINHKLIFLRSSNIWSFIYMHLQDCNYYLERITYDNLFFSSVLITWIGHREEISKLTVRALALRRSESVVCGSYTERWNYAIGWCMVTWITTQ